MKKLLKVFLLASVCYAFCLSGCQKGLNWNVSGTDSTTNPPDTITTVAAFNFIGDSVNCSELTKNGSYTADQTLSSSNTIYFKVAVTTPGKYTIGTDTADGFSFSGNGVITGTGEQQIYVTGTGTPQDSGTFTFIVKANGNDCSFSIHVNPASATDSSAGTGDFFPISKNSYWVYQDNGGAYPPTPLTITCTGATASFGGKTYYLFVNSVGDTNYYCKQNGKYYQYGPLGYFTSGYIDNPPLIEYEFMKDAPQGTTWETPEYNVTNNGVPVKAKISFTITYRSTGSVLDTVTRNYMQVMTKVQQQDPVLGWQEVQRYDAYYYDGVGLTEFADPRRIIRWGGLLEYKIY